MGVRVYVNGEVKLLRKFKKNGGVGGGLGQGGRVGGSGRVDGNREVKLV